MTLLRNQRELQRQIAAIPKESRLVKQRKQNHLGGAIAVKHRRRRLGRITTFTSRTRHVHLYTAEDVIGGGAPLPRRRFSERGIPTACRGETPGRMDRETT